MSSKIQAATLRAGRSGAGVAALLAVAAVLALSACGDKGKEKTATQTAAKVNKEEITVHQINYVLQQQRNGASAQAPSAGKAALERLIDQELAVQKAQDERLDRDARVVQQLEAARREILARAYFESVAAGASKPSAEEIKAYYDTHPALFKERRVYNFQEIAIQAKPEQVSALQSQLASSKDMPEFISYLKTNDFKFGASQEVRAAEQLPLASLDKFAKMKDGQTLFNATASGAQVVLVAATKSIPVDESVATPAIEKFLINERKRKVVDEGLKSLRAAAKVEYVGDYAAGEPTARAATAPATGAPELAPMSAVDTPVSTGSTAAGSTPGAAPQLEVQPIVGTALPVPAASAVEKGIKGLK